MKTGTLIILIFLGGTFVFIVAIFPMACPLYQYLPPIRESQKKEVTKLMIKHLEGKYYRIKFSSRDSNINVSNTLTKLVVGKKDPWGNPLQFKISPSSRIKIYSYGPDGKPHTKDDIKRKL